MQSNHLISFNAIKIPTLMGILNITPDSFSDGGEYFGFGAAISHAQKLLQDGAGIIDIGGESTRPGADYVNATDEMARVIPVVRTLRNTHPNALISVDTRKSEVARQAIELGADFVNDISALRDDPAMASLLAANPHVKVILMHMQGSPRNMQHDPHYEHPVPEIMDFLDRRIQYCEAEGITRDRILIDPGIGFGKTAEHNIEIITEAGQFRSLGVKIVMGTSRKRFISAIHPSDAKDRIGGTLATALAMALANVDILRVHDVLEHAQFFAVLSRLAQGPQA